MLKDFKKFLIKWNAVDLAVWFMFGAAFATVVKSLVNNIVMPPIWLLMGRVDFSELYIALDWNDYATLADVEAAWAPAVKYWTFINDVIWFVILGFVIFMLVRYITKLQKKEEKKPASKPNQEVLLEEIRDALVKKKK